MGFSVVVALAGIGLATVMYMKDPSLPGKFTAKFPTLHRVVFNKWYVDEIYDTLFVNSTKKLGIFCWKGFDVKVVDGIVNGIAKTGRRSVISVALYAIRFVHKLCPDYGSRHSGHVGHFYPQLRV